MARVVVLGAGLAGLAAAVRLADLRHDVTVLEQAGSLGTWWAAPTFTMPAPLRDLFRSTGRPLEREVDLIPVDPSMHVVFPDGTAVDLPNASRAGTRRALDSALGGGAGAVWDDVIQHGNRWWSTVRARVAGHGGRSRRSTSPVGSLPDFVHRHVPDDRLAALLRWYAASVGEPHQDAPETTVVLPYLEQTFGTWTVDGGPQRLIDALARRCAERGATIRYGTAAAGVTVAGRGVESVRLSDGNVLPADVVVAALQPTAVRELLAPPDSDLVMRRRRWRVHRPGAGTRTPAGRSSFRVVLRDDGEFDAQRARVVVPPTADRPAVTIHHPGVLDADCAPHVHASQSSAGALDWTAHGVAAEYAAQVIDAARPGLRSVHASGEATVHRIRTPYDLQVRTAAPGGLVFGLRSGDPPALLSRPGPRTGIRGLLLTGSGAHPGPGVPLTIISTGIVADLVGRA